jgi:hypothetical protein
MAKDYVTIYRGLLEDSHQRKLLRPAARTRPQPQFGQVEGEPPQHTE